MGKNVTRIRRTFTPQFKKDAVGLVQRGRSVTEVARDLGIARSLLQRWKDQLDAAPTSSSSTSNAGSQADEVRRLKKQLNDVTEERDILKKALAYFADDQK